ncbi:hypothetical protein EBR61_01565, partial [bacterium]|nr:hypothetical protein [bacterium]
HSQRYPIPSLEEREQVENMIECCYKLGYDEYADIIEEFFITEAEPNVKSKSATTARISKNVSQKADAGKEGESKEFPGKYHLGAGFYSSKQGGEAEFKNDGGNLRPVTPQEKEKLKGSKGGGAGAGGGKLATQTPAGVQPKSATPAKLAKDIPNDKWGDNPQEPDWMKGGDPTWGGAANQNSTWGDNPQEPDWAKGPAMWDKKVPPRVELPNMVRPKTGAPTNAEPPIGTKVGGTIPPPPPPKLPPPPPPKVELPYKAKIQNWAKKEKEFFDKGQDKPGSETRRTFAQALKDKVKGAAQAIKHGFQHEVHTFKTAAKAVGKVFSEPGGFRSLEKEEKKALVSVGIKVATTALFAAAGGGLAQGAAAFAKHVAVELVPHAVAETIVLGVGRASLFASSDGNDERLLSDFMDAVADRLENMEITPEMMDKMVDSFNAKNPTDTQSENISLDEILLSYLIKEESEGESTQFPGKFHLGGGFYSSKQGGEAEFKNDGGNLRPITPEEKKEFEGGNAGDTDQNALMKTAEDELAKKEKEYEEENPTDPKTDYDKILKDPSATAQDIAKAKAFKRKNDILKQKQKDDPEYQSNLKKEVSEKNNEIAEDLRGQKDSEGNQLDAETTENGSILIGVEHGDEKESTKQIIDKIKTLPKDAKVMFVGEGGVGLDDSGKVDFVGEQAEIRDACLEHFDNSREESWDENSDVKNSDAPIFDEIAKSFGGDKEKALASVWTNMVGQNDDLDADDYLTEETKEWIKGEARKGGSREFDGDVDWNNLTLEQKEDLYQLNYRDDQNYGETDLFKGQKAYNDYRQKELDRKIKEAEEKGYTVIATMGNSHVGMWRERNKKKTDSFKPQSLRNLQKELPEADKEVFNKESDLDKIPSDKKEEISMKIDELADRASKGEDFNLCQITVPGTNLYCDDNQGIPREEMPQFKGKPLPGTPAEDLPKDSKGEVDTEPLFKKMLKEKGIKTVETELPSDKLKATQSELVGSKVAGMTKALEEDPQNPGITAPIYVSRDGFVIDGHHRWAAVTSAAIKAGKPANMKVIVVDMDIKDAIPMCNQFAEEQGIAAKKADANDGEQPKPKEPNKKEGGVIYPIGGNYYSDTPNGPAQYIKSESVVREVFENENEKFLKLLFEANVTKKLPDGDTIRVTPIDVKDQPEATQKADDAEAATDTGDVVNVTPLTGKDYKEVSIKQMNQTKYKDSILDDELKEKISTIVGKMTKGEDLTEEEQAIAKDYIKIVNDKKVKIYVASKKKGDWSSQGYIKVATLGTGKAGREWADAAGKKYGVTIGKAGQGAVGKKDPTPAKIVGEEEEVEIKAIDENTVIFNGKKHKKLPIPTEDALRAQFKKNEPSISDEELDSKVAIALRKIKKRNDNIDELIEISKKNGGKFKTVNIGDTSTPDGRNEARKKLLDKSIDKFTQLLGDKKDLPENQQVMKTLDELRNFEGEDLETNSEKQKQYQELLNRLEIEMFNSKDFRDGVPDYAEVKVALELLSKGNAVYLPADEAFKTADVLVINEIDEQNTDIEFLLVSLEFSGGISVKVQGGAAGTSDEKWRQSRFKTNETRKRGNRMLSLYDSLYPEKQTPPDFPPSDEQLNEQKAALEDDKKWMVENGIATEEELKAAEEWGERRVAAVIEKWKDNGVFDCLNDEEKVRFEETMKIYYKNQKISEILYNNDLDYTNFGNSNQKFSISKGKAVRCESENLDGVEKPCYMKIKDDVGFNYSTQGDCTVVRPTNRNPSEIHKEKPKVK